MTKIKVIAYAEQCVMQGRAVNQSKIEELGVDSDDFVVYEGTGEELLKIADSLTKKYQSSYRYRLAATIREAVYWERPDLKPEPESEEEND